MRGGTHVFMLEQNTAARQFKLPSQPPHEPEFDSGQTRNRDFTTMFRCQNVDAEWFVPAIYVLKLSQKVSVFRFARSKALAPKSRHPEVGQNAAARNVAAGSQGRTQIKTAIRTDSPNWTGGSRQDRGGSHLARPRTIRFQRLHKHERYAANQGCLHRPGT